MSANLKNVLAVTGLEMSVFIPIPKKGNAKEYSNCCTIVIISHASKIMLKIFQARLSTVRTENFQTHTLGSEKAEELEMKLATSTGSQRNQGYSRKTSISTSRLS